MRVSTTGVVPPAMARLSSPCALSQAPTSSPAASPGNPAASLGNPAASPGICRCGAEQPADAAATSPWNTAPPPRPPVPLSGEVDAQQPLADRWSVVHRLLVPDLPRAQPFLPTMHEPHTSSSRTLLPVRASPIPALGARPPASFDRERVAAEAHCSTRGAALLLTLSGAAPHPQRCIGPAWLSAATAVNCSCYPGLWPNASSRNASLIAHTRHP